MKTLLFSFVFIVTTASPFVSAYAQTLPSLPPLEDDGGTLASGAEIEALYNSRIRCYSSNTTDN
jgi:hypothetical protein